MRVARPFIWGPRHYSPLPLFPFPRSSPETIALDCLEINVSGSVLLGFDPHPPTPPSRLTKAPSRADQGSQGSWLAPGAQLFREKGACPPAAAPVPDAASPHATSREPPTQRGAAQAASGLSGARARRNKVTKLQQWELLLYRCFSTPLPHPARAARGRFPQLAGVVNTTRTPQALGETKGGGLTGGVKLGARLR